MIAKRTLEIGRTSTPHVMEYNYAIFHTDEDNHDSIIDTGTDYSLSKIIEVIDSYCNTIDATKQAIVDLMLNDTVTI